MEAKDTVIETPDHSESVYCPHCGGEQGIEGLVRIVREAQAEISFKAGIREVVECVNGFMVFHGPNMWRRKREEWGIPWNEKEQK